MGPGVREKLRDIITGERFSLKVVGLDLEFLGTLFPKVDDLWLCQPEGLKLSYRFHYLSTLFSSFVSDLGRTCGKGEICLRDDVSETHEPKPQLLGVTEKQVQKATTWKWKDCGYLDKILCLQWQMIWLMTMVIFAVGIFQIWFSCGDYSVWGGHRQNYQEGILPVDISLSTEIDHEEELPVGFTVQTESYTEYPNEFCDRDHDFYEHFPCSSPEWWHLEETEGESKHRRNLLEDSLRSPSFGNGVAMHANNETYLSEFMIGLMIVEAFCIFLLSLYPPAKPYKKRIIGGGILSYSLICLFVNVVPFCQDWSMMLADKSPVGTDLRLPQFSQVDSERRETYQLYRESNWKEMHPLYKEVIRRDPPLSPLETIREKIKKYEQRYNIYCFIGYRRSVQGDDGSGNPMQYELAIGVSAESQKGIFTNVVPISEPLSLDERRCRTPGTNVLALMEEYASKAPLSKDAPPMFRAMISMNLLRLIDISVDGFQGVGSTPLFFLKNASLLAFSAKRGRTLLDRCFSIPQFWLTLLTVIFLGLLFFFWDLWKFRKQLIASHVMKLSFWGGLTLLSGSCKILPTVTLLLMIPLLTVFLLACKDIIMLRRGASWVFTRLGNRLPDCESLLPDSCGLNLLISRAMGVTDDATCMHYVTFDKSNSFFHSESYQSSFFSHKKGLKALGDRGRRTTAISETFRPGFMDTWTDQNGRLNFKLGSPNEKVLVVQSVLGELVGMAWGSSESRPIKIDKFSGKLGIERTQTRITSLISIQFSMIHYREISDFSRRFVLFLCHLAQDMKTGVYARAQFQHVLMRHGSGIPVGSDVETLITDFFEGRLLREELKVRIIDLIWRQLSFFQRVSLICRRINLGKPLLPIESLLGCLPEPDSIDVVQTRCRMRLKKVRSNEVDNIWVVKCGRNALELMCWGFAVFFLLNFFALALGFESSIPCTDVEYTRMRADLPLVTNDIASHAPVFPDYEISSNFQNIPTMSAVWWSLYHAGKLTCIPLLCIIEIPMILLTFCASLVDRVFQGETFGLASLFWCSKSRNVCSISPAITEGALSLGVTWDWQCNSDLYAMPVSWGNLWWILSPSGSNAVSPQISTMFTDDVTVEDSAPVGSMTGRRRLGDMGLMGGSLSGGKGSHKSSGKVSKAVKVSKGGGLNPRNRKKKRPSAQKPKASTMWSESNFHHVQKSGSASEKLAWSLIHPGVSFGCAGDRMPVERGRSKKRSRSSSSSSSSTSTSEERRKRKRKKKRYKKRRKRNQSDGFSSLGAKMASKNLRSRTGIEVDSGNNPAPSLMLPLTLSPAGRVPPIRKEADISIPPKAKARVYDSPKRVFPNRILPYNLSHFIY